ncbi:MAG: MFS transporter, partial [Alkalispirochaeta sp.]
MTDNASRPRTYLALGMVLNICLGTVYSWSVFRVPLESYFTVGAVESGLPYMLMLAVFSLTMPLAGTVLKRIGPRRTALIGGILLGTGWVASSWAPTMTAVSIFWGVLGGMGVGLTYVVPLTMAHAWFPARRGLAMGLVLGGFGMSPFVTAPIAEFIIERRDVLTSFRTLGIAFAVLIPLLAASFRMPEGGTGAGRHASGEVVSGQVLVSPRAMVKTREFYTLWIALLLGSIIGLGAIAITSPWAQRIVGLTGGSAALAVSILAIFNGVGRPLFGFLTDQLGLRRTASLAFVLTALAATVLLIDVSNSIISFAGAFAV